MVTAEHTMSSPILYTKVTKFVNCRVQKFNVHGHQFLCHCFDIL